MLTTAGVGLQRDSEQKTGGDSTLCARPGILFENNSKRVRTSLALAIGIGLTLVTCQAVSVCCVLYCNMVVVAQVGLLVAAGKYTQIIATVLSASLVEL